MSRGYTDEADRIINYLVCFSVVVTLIPSDLVQEYGIFDALEKQYLRKFMFAIYLVRLPPQQHV